MKWLCMQKKYIGILGIVTIFLRFCDYIQPYLALKMVKYIKVSSLISRMLHFYCNVSGPFKRQDPGIDIKWKIIKGDMFARQG